MKTICMRRDYAFRAERNVFVQFLAGYTYRRVTEAAAREILAAGAGELVNDEDNRAGEA